MTMRPITVQVLPPLRRSGNTAGAAASVPGRRFGYGVGVRALYSFTVRAHLPPALAPLRELATNLRWSWDVRTRDLFRWIDPDGWTAAGGDPVRLLAATTPSRLEELAADQAFTSFMAELQADLNRYMTGPMWFQGRESSPLSAVAYFSPEFGITEAVPQYSGGLGILAGDHLKAASGLGVPLVGVGLLYRQGYFRQHLGPDGWQGEHYPDLDPHAMALAGPEEVKVDLDLAGRLLVARIWRADVGRVRLYMLDTDIEENDSSLRQVADRLYGGDVEHRLAQEILLGVGGVRALDALGERAQVFHTNEGHAGFQGLERIRQLVAKESLSFGEALEAVRSSTIFTTHTPVPAGIDRFPAHLMSRYFSSFAEECGISFPQLMSLGHFPGEAPDAPFNMAVMGLRLASTANAVSKLHGHVSREMFSALWPDLPKDEVPITSVTNGVHGPTWVSREMDDLLTRSVLPMWHDGEPKDWMRASGLKDDQLWRVREQGREHLVAMVRTRVRRDMLAAGVPDTELEWCDEVLDPTACTIGFARRFAPYKRAALLLSDPERLKALLLSPDRPLQLVFAGKAHPADDAGKELIRSIVSFARDPEVRHRIAFVEDYDMKIARALYQGADVWLNTPRRPLEACGTSGMKAALNGALNCSVLDGWWDELYDGENGWAVGSREGGHDAHERDLADSRALFALLENQIVPLFYERLAGGVPRGWTRRVKASLRSLGPDVLASRMVREYTTELYEPAAARTVALHSEGFAAARSLAEWKGRILAGWDGVRIESVAPDRPGVELGSREGVAASVQLGSLDPSDVVVQLLHGPVGANGELQRSVTVDMEVVEGGTGTALRYYGSFECREPGLYGFTVRVMPVHRDLATPREMGVARWA